MYKSNKVRQSTDTFTAFSHVQYPGSHATLYTVFLRGYYWRLDTLVIMYSWLYQRPDFATVQAKPHANVYTESYYTTKKVFLQAWPHHKQQHINLNRVQISAGFVQIFLR